jgi:uncharacterized membrane protein YdbT with pleckstrin-like domain
MTDQYLTKMLGENETVLFVTRQHWFLLFLSVLTEILLALGIAALAVMTAFMTAGMALWGLLLLLLPGVSFLRDYLKWEAHQYVVTNRRVIQIMGVINKNVTDSSLEKVNDVKLEQSFLGRMFDYGDIEILTASELGINKLKYIHHPIQYKTAMLNAKQRLEGMPLEDNSNTDSIPTIITKLDDLRKMGILSEEEFQQKKDDLLKRI